MRRRVHATIALMTAAAACGAVACANGAPDQTRTTTTAAVARPAPKAAPNKDTATHVAEAAGEVAPDSMGPVTPRWITDANVLALLADMNAKQIAAASTELQGWNSDTVRAFASGVARTHADLQHSIDSLATHLRMTPVTPALAASFDSTFQTPADSLAGLKGKALDRAFVRQQIARTELLSGYIDQFASVAENPDVQTLLMMASTRVGSELGAARTLQALLATADSAAADSSAHGPGRSARKAAAR